MYPVALVRIRLILIGHAEPHCCFLAQGSIDRPHGLPAEAMRCNSLPSLSRSTHSIIPRLQPPGLSPDEAVISDDYYRQHLRSLHWMLHELETRYIAYNRLEVLLQRDTNAIQTAIWVREQELLWKEEDKDAFSPDPLLRD